MKTIPRVVFTIIAFIFPLTLFMACEPVQPVDEQIPTETSPYTEATVVEIIDAGCILVNTGSNQEVVRYIGVEIPDSADNGFLQEAAAANRELVEGKLVKLESDEQDKDTNGRLLRYVYAGETMINLHLLELGYMQTDVSRPNVKYERLFYEAEKQAKTAGNGIWAVKLAPEEKGFREVGEKKEKSDYNNISPKDKPYHPDREWEEEEPAVNRTTHGIIARDEIWRDEIHITGDIVVMGCATLTIEPGTRVLIAANRDEDNQNTGSIEMRQGIKQEDNHEGGIHYHEPYLDEGNHISIRVDGTFNAVGTEDNMIVITSDSDSPTMYDWNYLNFNEGTLSYCIVEYYRFITPGEKSVVSHNILRHIGAAGIGCGKGSPIIEYNEISDAGHEAVDMHGGSPTIRYNHLGPVPGNVGIIIDGGSPAITGNTIEGCSFGILFISDGSTPIIEDNTFRNNECDIQPWI